MSLFFTPLPSTDFLSYNWVIAEEEEEQQNGEDSDLCEHYFCGLFSFFNTSFDRLSYKHFFVGFLILSITISQQVKQVL